MNKKLIIMRSVCALAVLAVVLTAALAFLPDGGDEEIGAAVLKVGSSGHQVRTLQTKLNNWGYNAGTVDGIFGSNTLAAVKRFQANNGLTVDGIVGAKTAAALGMTLSGSSSSNSSYSSSDLYLLAKCIYAEARGEPYIGQVAIGAVVLNRVESEYYPDTIREVIYQPGQYAPTWDGSLNKTPDARTVANARYLLEHGSICPENVVGQNSIITGSRVYTSYQDPILGTTVYFCYL